MILSLFIVLLFVVSCGGGSGDTTSIPIPENSPDFEEIEIPTEFTPDEGYISQPDSHLVPVEIVSLFKAALTSEVSRNRVIDNIREVASCDDLTDEEIWDGLIYDFALDELQYFGSNLDEAVRNALANDLPLERLDEGFEINAVWPLIDYEIGGCEVNTNLYSRRVL